jgi:hypothetical protein
VNHQNGDPGDGEDQSAFLAQGAEQKKNRAKRIQHPAMHTVLARGDRSDKKSGETEGSCERISPARDINNSTR